MAKEPYFTSEVALVAEFCRLVAKGQDEASPDWTPYHETAGWDVLMVRRDGLQVGIEAKLVLNAKVLAQALPRSRWWDTEGPDHRAVLVPADGLRADTSELAQALGITVIVLYRYDSWKRAHYFDVRPSLPKPDARWESDDWIHWCPSTRCALPDYVPDVIGGGSAPVKLSTWKVKAIRLLILLERLGAVNRRHMKALQISPTRWTDHWRGFLMPGERGYVACNLTPDLKAQHPTVWAQIEAEYDSWAPPIIAEGEKAKPRAA